MTDVILTLNANCYLDTTKILCLINGSEEEEWVEIKNIKKNTLVKIYPNGYKKLIIKGTIKLQNSKNKTIHKLYKLTQEKNTNLIEDLYVSGQHSLLVDTLTEEQEKKSLTMWSNLQQINDKKLLMAWVNEDFEEISDTNIYTLYQLVLESDNKKTQYGIYANGILSESMSLNTFIKKNMVEDLE
jgi:hypothetical protein